MKWTLFYFTTVCSYASISSSFIQQQLFLQQQQQQQQNNMWRTTTYTSSTSCLNLINKGIFQSPGPTRSTFNRNIARRRTSSNIGDGNCNCIGKNSLLKTMANRTNRKNNDALRSSSTRSNNSYTSIGKGTSFDSSKLPWVSTLSTPQSSQSSSPSSSSKNKKQISILSWNILAQHLFDNSPQFYTYISPSSHPIVSNWESRWDLIRQQIIQHSSLLQSDIICLQEVEYTAFETDILPSLRSIGYDGIIQIPKKQRKGLYNKNNKNGKRSHGYGVATFWKKNRFRLEDVYHHSRTMLTTLSDNYNPNNDDDDDDNNDDENHNNCNVSNNKNNNNHKQKNGIIAILNCHLEGNPLKSVTRVRQLHKPIRQLKNKQIPHDHLIICGDFNCQLGSSVCSTYLQYGSFHHHQQQQEDHHDFPSSSSSSSSNDKSFVDMGGRVLSIEEQNELINNIHCHGYNMKSVYPMELVKESPMEYVTYGNTPGHLVVGLDQIWYHCGDNSNDDTIDDSSSSSSDRSDRVLVVGLKRPFDSDQHREQVLKYGLPSQFQPSDHLAVGCILEWGVCV